MCIFPRRWIENRHGLDRCAILRPSPLRGCIIQVDSVAVGVQPQQQIHGCALHKQVAKRHCETLLPWQLFIFAHDPHSQHGGCQRDSIGDSFSKCQNCARSDEIRAAAPRHVVCPFALRTIWKEEQLEPCQLDISSREFPPRPSRSITFVTVSAGAPIGSAFGNVLSSLLMQLTR